MASEKEYFEELCAVHALGELDAKEQAVFENMLTHGDKEYQEIYRDSISVSYLINTSLTRVSPRPNIKTKLLNTIRKRSHASFSISEFFEDLAHTLGFGSPQFGLIVSMLLLIVVIEIGAYAYLLYNDLSTTEQQLSSYESLVAEQQLRLTSLTTDIQQKDEILNVLQSPKIEVAIMNGLEVNPAGYGKIIWDPVRKIAILQISKLPSLPSDKDYQLWFLDKNKKPFSAGIFSVAEGNENYFKVSELPLPENKKDITAFAVTLEPKGGVPQPTGTMYLMGEPAFSN
ncbi:MAG: anti-sigma factor [Bacteroidota bacterium]